MARRNLPDADFFLPAGVKAARERRALLAAARRGPVLHVTHGGCLDGAGSDVVVRLAHGDDQVGTVYVDPAEVTPTLEALAGEALPGEGRALLLSDVSPQQGDQERLERALGVLNELGWRIEWRDHHGKQWGEGMLEAVQRKVDHLRVDIENHECGTSLCQIDLRPEDPFSQELASVVRDIDLWIRKDPRSDTLTEARHGMGSRALVAKLVRDRVVLDPALERAARAHRAEFERDLKAAIAAARVVEGRHKVGVVYGDFPGSQACHALREALGTDIEINLKPSGKFSIRSRKELPVVHLVARRFHGGGHPNASGGRLGLAAWEFPGYWLRRGQARAAQELARAAAEAAPEGATP